MVHEIDAKSVKSRLVAQRAELAMSSPAADEARETVELDQTRIGRLSRIDAMQSQAMSAEFERRREAQRGRIEAALRRIDEGEYGYCSSCGDEIEQRRLELDASVASCITCARSAGGHSSA